MNRPERATGPAATNLAAGGSGGGKSPGNVAGKAGCGPVRKSSRTKWRILTWSLVHLFIIVHAVQWLRGGTTLTPLEPSEAMQTLERGMINAGFIIFAAAILATAIFGRFFCGWGCHLIAYQDGASMLLEKIGLRPRPFRSRLLVWIPIGAAFYMFIWPSVSRAIAGESPPHWAFYLTTENFWATFPGLWISILSVIVCGGLIVLFLGNKGFCTYACPYGAFFSQADRFAPGKITVTDACNGCGHCTVACTSNIRVHEEVKLHRRVTETGCMKCLDCVSVCPMNALHYTFTRPEIGRKKTRAPRRYDLSWPEEILLAFVFLGSLFAFRGLYDAVPFLLSLGIATCTTYLVLLWLRNWYRPFNDVQSLTLRRGGRFTRVGVVLQIAVTALIAFAAHSSWIQYRAREASFHIAQASSAGDTAAMQTAARAAMVDFQFCVDRGLFDVAGWRLGLGSAQASLGLDTEAERNLTRALEINPKLARAHLSLADLMGRRSAFDAAFDHLHEAAQLEPGLAFGYYVEALLARGSLAQCRRGLEAIDRRAEKHSSSELIAMRDALALHIAELER